VPVFSFATIYRHKNKHNIKFSSSVLSNGKTEDMSVVEFVKNHAEVLNLLPSSLAHSLISIANNEAIPIIEKEVTPSHIGLYSLLIIILNSILISANIMSSKVMHVFGIDIVAGAICFPLTYSITAIIVELFGFSEARKAIIYGMVGNGIFVFFIKLAIIVQCADSWPNQTAFEVVLNTSSKVFFASMLALFTGDIFSSYVLAWIKEQITYLSLFVRILLSSVLGILIDSSIFLLFIHFSTSSYYDVLNMLINVLFHKFSYELFASIAICPLIKIIKNNYPSCQYQPLKIRLNEKV